ncbi:MAG: helix-turn-helix transcriptional regulator [Cyanobacteria bacterium J06628_3]
MEVKVICKLKELMEAKNITQTELSERTGLASTTIGRLYRNHASRVDFETLEKLIAFFELSTISDLLEAKVIGNGKNYSPPN